jgi:hypothetical protein
LVFEKQKKESLFWKREKVYFEKVPLEKVPLEG